MLAVRQSLSTILAVVLAPSVALMSPSVVGQQSPVPPAADRDIQGFVTDQTVSVIKMDLEELDLDRMRDWGEELVQDIEANGTERQLAMLRIGRQFGQFETWTTNMKEAGAEKVYFVLNIEADQRRPVAVVPKVEAQQMETVKALLRALPETQRAFREPDDMDTAVIRDAVVFADEATIDRLQQPQPLREATRQLVQDALESVDDAAIRGAFRTDRDGREAARQQGINLDERAVEATDWIAWGIQFPDEDRAAKIVVKARDSDTADTIASRFKDFLEEAEGEADDRPVAARLAAHRDALEPSVEDDRVIITLSRDEARSLLADALVHVEQARYKEVEKD